MDVSPAVMTNVSRYMEWHKINGHALLLEDILIASVSHMSPAEKIAYDHMVGLFNVSIGVVTVETLPPPPAPSQQQLVYPED
jgi:hypothetical protein